MFKRTKTDARTPAKARLTPIAAADLAKVTGGETTALHVRLPPPSRE